MSETSTDALEGFLMLVKSNKGLACVMVIQQVLKHPQIFVFGELLEQPNVQSLQNTEHKPWLELLRIFAYGTWRDYQGLALSIFKVLIPRLKTPLSN